MSDYFDEIYDAIDYLLTYDDDRMYLEAVYRLKQFVDDTLDDDLR